MCPRCVPVQHTFPWLCALPDVLCFAGVRWSKACLCCSSMSPPLDKSLAQRCGWLVWLQPRLEMMKFESKPIGPSIHACVCDQQTTHRKCKISRPPFRTNTRQIQCNMLTLVAPVKSQEKRLIPLGCKLAGITAGKH